MPVDPAAEVVVEPVDEWAEPATSKKSKKNKKKGKAVTEPEPELTPETIAEPVHEPVLEPTIDPAIEPTDLVISDVLPTQDAAPVASEQPAIDPVDEWAEPATTKKSKKNKKKGKGAVEVEPEPEPVLQSAAELAPEPVAELATGPVTESVSVPVGTMATDAPAATEEPVAETFDEWAEATTSKKGKKNKKAKGVAEPEPKLEPEALSEPTPEPATESPAEPVDLVTADVPVPSEEPMTEPADEWAELKTSKKGKKNKKKGKGLNVESPLEPAVQSVTEAAVDPVTAPVVEPEAVSEPAPEVQTAVQTELVAPLDDGSRNLDTPPAEPGSPAEDQSSAAVDDWADFSSSKKSKKNKKKTKATDEPAPAIAEELPRAQDEIRETFMDAAADPIVAAEPTLLPEQEPVADEFADLGSKKSKKNKKKAKGIVSVEPETAAKLQSEPAQDVVDSTAIEPSSTLSDPPTVLEEIPVIESSTLLDQDAIAAADEWADFGVKKNKKGKKSKGVTFDDTELPPTTDVTEPSRNTDSSEPGLPEDDDLAEATAIPEAEVEPVIEAEVSATAIGEWADSGSKKSKKKKRGKSVASDEPETTVETAAEPVATQDELVLPSDPAPIETLTLPQEVETSTEQASSAPVDEWNDFGSTKKSKKKKKGKGSVLDELEPATSAPLEAPSEAAIVTQVVSDSVDPTVAGDVTAEPFADTPADTEASTPVDDWASGFSTKKSKKGKKKTKGSAFDEPEPLVEPAAEETPDVIVEAPVEVGSVPAAEPEVANPVDEWAESSNKKSKKDKKKKRQSTAWDDTEPSIPASTESPAPDEEPVIVDAPRDLSIEADQITASNDLLAAQPQEVQEPVPASSESSVEEIADRTIEEVVPPQGTPQPVEEPAEDPVNFSSVKKSKKDKKKERDSLAQFDEEPQPVQGDAVPALQEEPVFDTAIGEDPAVVLEVVEEPFADSFSTKKSKKDTKKAKRQSVLVDSEPATPAESPIVIEEAPATYAETPIVEEQQADIAETPAAAEAEPSIVAEDVKPIDLELPAVVPGAVEDKPTDQPLDPVQTADDADWGTFAIPSKKSKKGKKGKASADTSEPVSRALSPFRELDSAVTSAAIEGPEAVPEAVPEIGEPAFEEPAPQPEPVVDDEWALPPKKKKGKKGKAAAVVDADNQETSLLVESPPPLEEVPSTTSEVVDIIEATEQAPAPVEPVLAEPSGEPEPVAEDEWALPSSKKKKKGKKGKAAETDVSEPADVTAVDVATVETPTATTEPVVVEPIEPSRDSSAPVEVIPAEPSGEPEPMVEDEWAAPSSKKKKKGKKGKMAAFEDPEPTSRALSPVQDTAVPPMLEVERIEAATDAIVDSPAVVPEPVVEDEWAPTPKKKKGKKNKGAASFDSPEPTSRAMSPVQDINLPASFETGIPVDTPVAEPEPIADTPMADVEPIVEDEWTPPTSKKKKGKKGKAAAVFDLSEPVSRAVSPTHAADPDTFKDADAQDVETSAPFEARAPIDETPAQVESVPTEDEWALPATTKKCKKGKKNKAAAILAEAEPQPEPIS
ncbi:hypothetical protein VDGD_20813 [Verticillium dahliae]|nr:hypothetical protein VDGD_20813 [Verticillium dahliae]